MKNYYLLAVLAACLCFTGCGKDDDDKPVPVKDTPDPAQVKLITDLLSAHTWQLTSLTEGTSGSTVQNDIYNTTFPACQRDDVYGFSNDNKVTITDGAAVCSGSTQPKTGTWALKNGVKAMEISVASLTQTGLTGIFDIVLLTNNQLILKQTANGKEYVATYQAYTAPTKTDLLITKTWKISGLTVGSTGNPDYDIYAGYSPCNKDDILDFTTTRYTMDEGPSKCNPIDPQVYDEGTWSLTNNEIKLVIDSDSEPPTEFEIVTLDATTLKIKTSHYDPTVGTITETLTYTAI